jgi:hypothetical protein
VRNALHPPKRLEHRAARVLPVSLSER